MKRSVEAGSNEVVHAGIHNRKLFLPRIFGVQDLCDQNTSIAHDHAARLQYQGQILNVQYLLNGIRLWFQQ